LDLPLESGQPAEKKYQMSDDSDPRAVIGFWEHAGPERWFRADPAFDRRIAECFGAVHLRAAQGALRSWETDAAGSLALLLLTDQFPRNIYRHSAHAFATDALAREVAGRALAKGFDQAFLPSLRQFFYLPYSHHEDAGSQAQAVALYARLVADGGDPQGLRFAKLHAQLIARFGRFPHRNIMMGRLSTPEETAYLAEGGFSG
jgi:uncharacterized protein (DUF924 family)